MIQSLEDSKKLRKYMSKLGREKIALRIIEIAQEIVEQDGAYVSTIINAGKIHALALACREDSYWSEKAGYGFSKMVDEANLEVTKDTNI